MFLEIIRFVSFLGPNGEPVLNHSNLVLTFAAPLTKMLLHENDSPENLLGKESQSKFLRWD